MEAWQQGATLIATPRAIEQHVPDVRVIGEQGLTLSVGDTYDIGDLAELLMDRGYRMAPVCEGHGQLAVRGGLLDIFPFTAEYPLRLEFFGDDIDSIRRFDAFTQESIATVQQAVIADTSTTKHMLPIWQALPEQPVIVLADVPLRKRLPKDHGRAEIRLGRHLDHGDHDGGSISAQRFIGDALHRLP